MKHETPAEQLLRFHKEAGIMEYKGGLDPRKVAADLGLDLGRSEPSILDVSPLTEPSPFGDETKQASGVSCHTCGWENSFFPDQRSFEKASASSVDAIKWPTQDDFYADPDKECANCGEDLTDNVPD